MITAEYSPCCCDHVRRMGVEKWSCIVHGANPCDSCFGRGYVLVLGTWSERAERFTQHEAPCPRGCARKAA